MAKKMTKTAHSLHNNDEKEAKAKKEDIEKDVDFSIWWDAMGSMVSMSIELANKALALEMSKDPNAIELRKALLRSNNVMQMLQSILFKDEEEDAAKYDTALS